MNADWSAERQQRLANGIRQTPMHEVLQEADALHRYADGSRERGTVSCDLATLAAAAMDDRIWDALVQYRTEVAMNRAAGHRSPADLLVRTAGRTEPHANSSDRLERPGASIADGIDRARGRK